MEVRPLGITQIDWPSYIDLFKATIGKSPTDNLDAYYMKPDSLAAFMASLYDGMDPRQVLRTIPNVLGHVFASFMIESCSLMMQQAAGWGLHCITYPTHRGGLIIASGSIKEWKDTIAGACQDQAQPEEREAMSKCLSYLERAGFKEVFSGYRKEPHRDGSIVLREK